MPPLNRTILAVTAMLALGSAALAQGVTTPNTEPSNREAGQKNAQPPSAAPGSATVLGREFSNGRDQGSPADPKAAAKPAGAADRGE